MSQFAYLCSNDTYAIHITGLFGEFVLTVICMLIAYTFSISFKSKTAAEIVQAYVDNICARFGGSTHSLSDSGTELKNTLFENVAKKLEVKCIHYTFTL